jgi:hypothetical protein
MLPGGLGVPTGVRWCTVVGEERTSDGLTRMTRSIETFSLPLVWPEQYCICHHHRYHMHQNELIGVRRRACKGSAPCTLSQYFSWQLWLCESGRCSGLSAFSLSPLQKGLKVPRTKYVFVICTTLTLNSNPL